MSTKARVFCAMPAPNGITWGGLVPLGSQFSMSDFHITSSKSPWKPPSTMAMRLRPVKPRAVLNAPITASVPELAKRILSICGHKALTCCTTWASKAVEKPVTVPPR